jgi:hypothetical protein
MNARSSVLSNQSVVGLSVLIIGAVLAWEVGNSIVSRDLGPLRYLGLAFVACVVAIAILRNWRLGFYFFLVWILFEDLVRKFLGNNMAIYFAKDVLAGIVYVSFFLDVRKSRAQLFRPPFRLFLMLFLWLGVMQIFNFNSPHILYGLMGFKIYFYYMPLMFVGYALIRNDEELRKFLVVNAVLAGAISVIGIIQAIAGRSFLNPTTLAPELAELGDLDKVTPLTQQILSLPTSVFVSSGRFALYLTLAEILVMGSAGYLLLYTKRSRGLMFLVFGIVGVATLFSGARGALVIGIVGAFVLAVAFLWGAPWRWRQAHRMVTAIRRSFVVAALSLTAIVLIFPEQAGSRLAFYTETLLPNSSAYQLGNRSWEYPIYNLELAFSNPNWVMGNGIGTGSLGTQYVAKILGRRPQTVNVEEGFGLLIVELGILAPFLWVLWAGALLYYSWTAVRGLRETRFFPLGVAILWYSFVLLFVLTYGSLASFQNYISNMYLWLLIGVLFKLPHLLANTPVPQLTHSQNVRRERRTSFWDLR